MEKFPYCRRWKNLHNESQWNGFGDFLKKTGEILNQAEMGGTYDDNTRSSIAISGSNLFIRTNENLYCIE